jgi:hypothetical protein
LEDTHRLVPLQALLLLARELLMHGIEAKGDSKAATGGLVAVRTMWVSIASLGLSVLSVRGWLGGRKEKGKRRVTKAG